MQKKNLGIFFIILCVFLNIIFAGALIQKPGDSANDAQNASEPTVRMVSSFPLNTTFANILSSQFTTNASSFISDPEKLIITNVESNLTSNTFLVTILNNGSSQIIITDVLVSYHSAEIEDEIVIPPNACAVLLVNLNDEIVFLRTYEIKVQSSEGYYTTFFDVIF